ncbi:HlyD family efflux transporter periplasmic adaptor subunit [Actinomadura sp. WMMB 499]|nr:HlyD family efflux transporter periplasmic adaptor subunit [Actinomadura sp. WMMB 499]
MRGGRKAVAGAAAVLAAAVAGIGIAVTATAGEDGRPDAPGTVPSTAPVVRGDLSDGTSVGGTLGYGGRGTVKAGAAGVVTRLRGPGSVAGRDDALYELDGIPVRLMYGKRPMYRTLEQGVEGPDVRQLEENLRDLGHGAGVTVDDEFTWATAAAVRRWQRGHDREETGKVALGEVAFAAGPVRIESRDAGVGDRVAPGAAVLTTTTSERVVEMELGVDEASLVEPGTEVTVRLPGGRDAGGAVRSVGTTATGDDEEGGDGEATVKVVVELEDGAETGRVDRAPVTVELTTRTREDVLSVPVQALLALPGGGYGVRAVEGASTRTIQVEPGIFGDGRVEVAGDGLRAGMKVEVPSP